MCIYVCAAVCKFVCVCRCICMGSFVVGVHVCAFMCCMHAFMYGCTHTHIYIYIHVYECMYVWGSCMYACMGICSTPHPSPRKSFSNSSVARSALCITKNATWKHRANRKSHASSADDSFFEIGGDASRPQYINEITKEIRNSR